MKTSGRGDSKLGVSIILEIPAINLPGVSGMYFRRKHAGFFVNIFWKVLLVASIRTEACATWHTFPERNQQQQNALGATFIQQKTCNWNSFSYLYVILLGVVYYISFRSGLLLDTLRSCGWTDVILYYQVILTTYFELQSCTSGAWTFLVVCLVVSPIVFCLHILREFNQHLDTKLISYQFLWRSWHW